MARTSPIQFIQQVRQEVSKVTWPSRKETVITTAMVIVMVIIMSIFFLIVDQILGKGVGLLLSVGG